MHYLQQIHRGIVLTLGYLCIVFLVLVGAAEMINRWQLAEGIRPFYQHVTYDYPEGRK